jgi:hypothetical protein
MSKNVWRAVAVLIFIGLFTVVIYGIIVLSDQDAKVQAAQEKRNINAETCRYIWGYGGPVADPFHIRRMAAACSHEVLVKGGTVDEAVHQCFPEIDACEKGLAQ